ncbi:hypothetical protein E2C01_069155 [Portunus trituberculatus]|uniref:Uncharacterized protein n=1 Tax=Portunus trituberculatus TaxID=210409 RepID=A0A5B7HQP8_PORTR|nr:hypothetical protein [Portunus trituberculatus]
MNWKDDTRGKRKEEAPQYANLSFSFPPRRLSHALPHSHTLPSPLRPSMPSDFPPSAQAWSMEWAAAGGRSINLNFRERREGRRRHAWAAESPIKA